MDNSTIHDIKKELSSRSAKDLVDICVRLGKFKKENKELLSYLLFEADDENGYVQKVKESITTEFEDLPKPNLYLTKKVLRKIIRGANKHARYMASKASEAEILIHVCSMIQSKKIPLQKSQVLYNLYAGLIKKINGIIDGLHEDLQYDLRKSLENLA
jgi:hypothetical protein